MHMRNNIRVVVEHGSMTQAIGRAFLTGIRRLHRNTTGGLPVKQLGLERPIVVGLIKVDKPSNKKQEGPASRPFNKKQAGPVDKPSSGKQPGPGNNPKTMPFRALGVENRSKTTVVVAIRAVAVDIAVAGLVAEDLEDQAGADLAVEDPAVVGLVTEDLVVEEAVVVEVLDS